MKDKELWLNGSGYPDPTAYKAMKGMVDMENRVGEVWEVNTHKGTKTVLVVANKEDAFTFLELFDEEKEFADITVTVNGKEMYTNSAMMTYGFENRFAEYVATLSDDDFGNVLQTIGRTFDIPMMPVTDFVRAAHDNTLKKDAEIAELKAEIEKLSSELQDEILKDEPSTREIELTAERNLYKTLYEQAFERLIAR